MSATTSLTTPPELARIAIRAGSFTASLGGSVLAFDLEGRLYMAFLDGSTFQRGLDGRVLAKERRPGSSRRERWVRECETTERLEIYRSCHALARALWAAHHAERTSVIDGGWERATVLLSRALAWTPDLLEEERVRFRAVYLPPGILPPDQYLSVLLQATEGCAWNKCTFCAFYRDRQYRVKREEEFLAHAIAVKRFLGEGVRLRRSIFLGDANALGIPQRRLIRMFEIAREAFPDQKEIHTFMDIFTVGKEKGPAELRALGERGLRRVTIGLETGCDELLQLVRKPGSSGAALRAVRLLKESGIEIGVTVLLGLGEVRYFDEHVSETIRVLNAMGLGEGDIVYFSPLTEFPGLEYFAAVEALGIGRLRADEVAEQEAIIRAGLHFGSRPPTLARYDVRQFIY
jgi:hypothetical protein